MSQKVIKYKSSIFFQVFKACFFKKRVKSHFARRLWPSHVSVISYLRISCNIFWSCPFFSHFLSYPPAPSSPYTFVLLLVLNSPNIVYVVHILVGVWPSLESHYPLGPHYCRTLTPFLLAVINSQWLLSHGWGLSCCCWEIRLIINCK